MEIRSVLQHYDTLISENNDPVHDSIPLKRYMDKWDGELFLKELNLKMDSSVLEIGVGTGRLALKVLEQGCGHFSGIDLSAKTLSRTKENLEEYHNFDLYCGDYLESPVHDNYDIIYSSLTFFHISNKKEAIEKTWSLLKANGRFVLGIEKSTGEFLEYGSYKVKMYPDNTVEITRLLTEAGFKQCSVLETEFAFILSALRQEE
jgi:ubiquinone/menaquinone biosynthesis C-methylase UbiE